MILERYLTDFLTRNFGHLVEGLDPRQIQISTWKGEIVLKNLQLKPQGLVHYGSVGYLEIKIPWKVLQDELFKRKRSEDMEITVILSNVNILLTPRDANEDTGNAKKEAADKEELVQQALGALLIGSSQKWRDRIPKLLKRLRVTVQNIHVRYEDDGSSLGLVRNPARSFRFRPAFAIGITLHSFAIENQSKIAAEKLAVYWDSDALIMIQSQQDKSFNEAFRVINDTGMGLPHGSFSSQHSYVLDPFSPSLEIILDETSSLTAQLPPCHFTISRHLLDDLVYLRKSIALSKTLTRDSNSPTVSPLEDPRAWWLYAYETVRPRRRKHTWGEFCRILAQRVRYLTLYQSFLETEAESLHEELVEMEDRLTVDEIVAFRRHTFSRLKGTAYSRSTSSTSEEGIDEDIEDRHSSAYRKRVAVEMIAALKAQSLEVSPEESRSVWDNQISCPEVSLQINDRPSHRSHHAKSFPVVRLSFAFQANQTIQSDLSWEIEAKLGSLVATDLTVSSIFKKQQSLFSTLVGSKSQRDIDDGNYFELLGSTHLQNAWFRFDKSPLTLDDGLSNSRTSLKLRILPLDIVYSTKPVEALSRIFGPANSELADDYQKFFQRVSAWRERQKMKLLNALSQRDRQIIVEVSIGAPTLLLPEGESISSNILAIDLGNLKFSNSTEFSQGSQFDDKWDLDLQNISVKKLSGETYLSYGVEPGDVVVEPFTLSFEILTKVEVDELEGQATESATRIRASLPHLEFNLTASALRLIRRLQTKWRERKLELSPLNAENRFKQFFRRDHHHFQPSATSKERRAKIVEFFFNAPLLLFKVENDVDGRDSTSTSTTAVVDIAFRGIEGRYMTERLQGGHAKAILASRIRSLQVIDRYQKAGKHFSGLLSSTVPDPGFRDPRTDEPLRDDQVETHDLVRIEYESPVHDESSAHTALSSRLAFQFFELFVEWNPETLAAISKCFHVPKGVPEEDDNSSSDGDEFYDAEEDTFHDVASVETLVEVDPVLSEVSSRQSSVSDFAEAALPNHFPALYQGPLLSRMASPSKLGFYPFGSPSRVVEVRSPFPKPVKSKGTSEVAINLIRLRIRFNKETRHRRVFVAEMETTSIKYQSKENGSSTTLAELGNLTISDPSSSLNRTLYRDIIGLQSSSSAASSKSLLSMTISRNKRSRRYGSLDEDVSNSERSVHVDFDRGRIAGYDMFIHAKFSPMRFVYIQQLWFEIVDYFFEGIVGYEVWGNERPTAALLADALIHSRDPERISVTRFDIDLDSPVILLPVTYLSTDYLKIEASSLRISNKYDLKPLRMEESRSGSPDGILRDQWFNNVLVKIESMKLLNASGGELTRSGDSLSCQTHINWPTGPSAPLNVPKWQVRVGFDQVKLLLQKEDYGLLQNFISFNLNEVSRNMDEWYAIKSLPEEVQSDYLDSFFVKYGYDKKDVTPSTFDVMITSPEIVVALRSAMGKEIGIFDCHSVKWMYNKGKDRIGKMTVDSFIDIKQPLMMGGEAMMRGKSPSPSKTSANLSYTSTTQQSGDNRRELSLENASMMIALTFWSEISGFFSSLPAAQYSHPQDVIQVGDRWYKISENESPSFEDDDEVTFTWLPNAPGQELRRGQVPTSIHVPTYVFAFNIVESEILVGKEKVLMANIPKVGYLHEGHRGLIQRSIQLSKFECGFLKRVDEDSPDRSLFESLTLRADLKACNGKMQCKCRSHTSKVRLDEFKSVLAFSDILRSVSLLKELQAEVEVLKHAKKKMARDGIETKGDSLKSKTSVALDHSFLCPSFLCTIVDDTGRHFATDQSVTKLSGKDIVLSRRDFDGSINSKLSVASFTIFDCLQKETSAFHRIFVASPRSENSELPSTSDVQMNHAIELSLSRTTETVDAVMKCSSLKVQYNPSLVVAMQRYLGRLKKMLRSSNISQQSKDNDSPETKESDTRFRWKVRLDISDFNASLNKEHQGRSLLQLETLVTALEVSGDNRGTSIIGSVGRVFAWDSDNYPNSGILPSNRDILRSSSDNDEFLHVAYYHGTGRGSVREEMSDWMKAKLPDTESGIDDCLKIRISPFRLVHFTPRMKELVDYLSNGLPGRGMGLTSRAAKGFVKDRIARKSFFDVEIGTVSLHIPRSVLSSDVLELKCGRTIFRSWVECDGERSMTFRQVDGAILVTGSKQAGERVVSSDLSLSLEILSTNVMTKMTCHLSEVDLELSYSQYTSIRSIMNDNLFTVVDRDSWDNLEVKWEKEADAEDLSLLASRTQADITYSDNARIVRYGASKSSTSERTFESEIRTPGVTLRFVRDDRIGVERMTRGYCMIVGSLSRLSFTFNAGADDQRAVLSLDRFLLKDAGSAFRELNRGSHLLMNRSKKFDIILDGYIGAPSSADSSPGSGEPTQFVLMYDRTKEPANETKLTLILNQISFTFLQDPLEELLDFLRLKWNTEMNSTLNTESIDEEGAQKRVSGRSDRVVESVTRNHVYKCRVVLHYPRVVLLANEYDSHTKALVLQGLAIVNGERKYDMIQSNVGEEIDTALTTTIHADFQNVSSVMHSDVSLHVMPSYTSFKDLSEESVPSTQDDTAVPLLLPLTVSAEVEEISHGESGKKRNVVLYFDTISLILSRSDVELIKALAARIRSTANAPSAKPFQVKFENDTLGLGLRSVDGFIVVDSSTIDEVHVGDVLRMINLFKISTGVTLAEVVEMLKYEQRPLTLHFVRPTQARDLTEQVSSNDVKFEKMSLELDISVSKASLAYIDREIPLLRGSLSSLRFHFTKNVLPVERINALASSNFSIDYYNLRIWEWEPFIEPGYLSISSNATRNTFGSRDVQIELTDNLAGPICLNLTDASALAISKMLVREDTDTLGDVAQLDDIFVVDGSRNQTAITAADVAFQFARRQKDEEGKPFYFSNKSGLSCVFGVVEKNVDPDHKDAEELIAVGEYQGLENRNLSGLTEVAADESVKFTIVNGVDRASVANISKRNLPQMTIAFQSMQGLSIAPLENLDLLPGQYILPVHFERDGHESQVPNCLPLSWSIVSLDDRTSVVLGSTVRIISLIHEEIEIAFLVEAASENRRQILGHIKEGAEYYVPLWVLLRRTGEIQVRIKSAAEYATVLALPFQLEDIRNSTKIVECATLEGRDKSISMTVSAIREDSFVLLSIDCSLLIRNTLPVDVEWQVQNTLTGTLSDGSSTRGSDLRAGSSVEVYCGNFEDLRLRINLSGWTGWLPLVQFIDNQDPSDYTLSSKDVFGVPENIGLRVARNISRLEITLFAELWIVNATEVPLSFGMRSSQLESIVSKQQADTDMSAAEAALQEISSIFDPGEHATPLGRSKGTKDEYLSLSQQFGVVVSEDCFEYMELQNQKIKCHWWSTKNSTQRKADLTKVQLSARGWFWIDSEWRVDTSPAASNDGWQSSKSLDSLGAASSFDNLDRFRRRRWFRRRSCNKSIVNAITHRGEDERFTKDGKKKGKLSNASLNLALKVSEGPWSSIAALPSFGVNYGAVRVSSKVTEGKGSYEGRDVYEFCHATVPLNGELGSLTRLMVITPRFLIRNDSKDFIFEVKQSGSRDTTAVKIRKGCTEAFHWIDSNLPQLISIRLASETQNDVYYRWSGGFDPLSIGVLPIRQRALSEPNVKSEDSIFLRSVKVEVSIRPKSGDTGINISLIEEDWRGDNALFRVENESPYPIWVTQDGLFSDPSRLSEAATKGDLVMSSRRMPFALDVPFRQGKYSHRKAATHSELLRVRVGLGPLTSRCGIETTKVISITSIGDTIRLNPSKFPFLGSETRKRLLSIRILGVVTTDGPTRVLKFRLIGGHEKLFSNPFSDDFNHQEGVKRDILSLSEDKVEAIISASKYAIDQNTKSLLPLEDKAISEMRREAFSKASERLLKPENLSFRMSLSGLIVSLVDESPSEIALVSMKNLNVLGNYDYRRTTDSTLYVTVADLQVDNLVPNAPYGVAVCRDESLDQDQDEDGDSSDTVKPLLVIGIAVAPAHESGVLCINSVTMAPRDMFIRVDLAFLVRVQKFLMDLSLHLKRFEIEDPWVPKVEERIKEMQAAATADIGSQRLYFGGLTILPCNIRLSVEPARALTVAQAALEGEKVAAIHQAVRKGDVKLGGTENSIFGVKVGHRNATPLAVMRGVFKSIVVDALLRLDGASLNFAGVSFRNHNTTTSQLRTQLVAHYVASLRQNLPALLGSMSAFGNPLGLVRGLGDGVSDFVLEPVKGIQKSLKEMDASYLVDGVAKGTISLARHTVGGFADSAAALTETFSKNMTVLTLDRRYAQKRDRGDNLRVQDDVNVALGLGSGVQKLALGFIEGVTGVVKAPIRGAEKRGFEGFAKGIGKGLLGLLVKPIIGISDGITDVMIGVKGSVGGGESTHRITQIRPRRPVYGRERRIRVYTPEDAVAAALMQRTRLAGEHYLGHLEMKERLALLSVRRLLVLGRRGNDELLLKYKHIDRLEIRRMNEDEERWAIVVVLNTPRRNGSEVEVIVCDDETQAKQLKAKLEEGMDLVANE